MIITVPGGQVVLREKPSVGGRQLMQEALFEMIHIIKTKMPEVALGTLADLKDLPVESLDGEFVKAAAQLQNAGIVAFVKEWSIKDPLPTLANIGDMDTDVYDEIAKVTGPMIASAATGMSFDPKDAADPKAPTPRSSDLSVIAADQEAL